MTHLGVWLTLTLVRAMRWTVRRLREIFLEAGGPENLDIYIDWPEQGTDFRQRKRRPF